MIAALALAVPAGRLPAGVVLAGESDKSGPIGLAVILVLCILSYLLFKSMSKHLRKVREEFPADGQSPAAASGAPGAARPTATTVTPTATVPTTPTAASAPSSTETTPKAKASTEEHSPPDQATDETR